MTAEEHVGGWSLIEVWVEHPENMDAPNHKTNPDHPILDLVDVVANAAMQWSKDYQIDLTVSGSLNANSPFSDPQD